MSSFTRPNRLRSALFMALASAALGCGPVDDFEEEEIGVAESYVTTVVTSLSGAFRMQAPNGTKVVYAAGQLHTVWAEGGAIRYTNSMDGVTWTSPVVLATPSASVPTVAVASNGTIGVAFVQNGNVKYVYKPLLGTWSAPVQITSDFTSQYASDVSMVAYGSNMHITWLGSTYVQYVTFPASAAGVPLATSERINIVIMCGTTTVAKPAIAVSRKSATDATPLVRVAYFTTYQASTGCPGTFELGMVVAQRPNVVSAAPWNNNVYGGMDQVSAATSGYVSLSMAAVPSTGDFYVAYSMLINGVGSTKLLYENAWDATDPWRAHTLATQRTIVDVTAQIVDCVPRLRVADSDFVAGNGSYGPSWYRTGSWVGAAAMAPTWIEASPVTVNPLARNAEALFFRKGFGLWSSAYVRTIPTQYEQLVTSAYSIAEENMAVPGRLSYRICDKAFATSVPLALQPGPSGGGFDAEISKENADKNDGAGTTAIVGMIDNDRRRMLLQFDLSPIPPNSIIESAKVTLMGKSNGGGNMVVRAIKEPWTEDTVTWASLDGGLVEEPVATFPILGAFNWDPVSIDVTKLVQAWLDGALSNNGIALEMDGSSFASFRTREANEETKQPQLNVSFIPGK